MFKFLIPPKFSDSEITRKAETLHNFALGSATIVSILQLIEILVLPQFYLRWLFAIFIYNSITFSIVIINKKGHIRTSSYIFILSLIILTFGFASTAGGIEAPVVMIIPVIVIIAGLLLGWKESIYSGIVISFLALGLVLLEQLDLLPQKLVIHYPLSIWVSFIASIGMIALIQYFSVNSLNKALSSAKNELHLRRKTEEDFRSSELFRKRVFESSRIPIVVMDVISYECIDCNQAAVDIYKFQSKEEVIGKSPTVFSAKLQYDGSPSEDKAKFYIDKALAEGSTVFDWIHQRPDGELWDAEVHLMSFKIDNRQLLQFSLIDITDRRKVGTALRESESQFRNLWEATVEGILIHDQGILLELNDALCRMTGYAREQAIGKFLLSFIPEEVHKYFSERLPLGLVNGTILPIIKADGKIILMEAQAKDIIFKSKPARMVALRDITEQNQAEKKLRESEEKYRLLVQHSNDPIFGFNPDETYRYVNDAFAKPFGKSPDEIIGKTPHSLFPFEEAEKRLKIVRKVFQTGVNEEIEVKVITKSGEEKYFLTTADPIKDEVGKVLWVSCVSKDITGRKLAENKLRESEERYKMVSELTSDYVYKMAVDVNGKVNLDFVSDSFSAITGRNLDEARTIDTWTRIFHKDDLSNVMKFLQSLMVVQQKGELECRTFVKGGKLRWINIIAQSEWSETEQRVVSIIGSIKDITERKQIEESLRKSEAQLSAFMNFVPALILIKDHELKPVFANENYSRLFPVQEWMGKKPAEIFSTEIAEQMIKKDLEAMEKGYTSYEETWTDKQGIEHIFFTQKFRITIPGDQHLLGAIISDITDRKTAEDALRKTNILLEQTLKQSPVPMVLVSMPDVLIRYVNPACIKFLGTEDEPSVINTSLINLKPSWKDFNLKGDITNFEELPLPRSLKGIKTEAEERCIIRKDGTIRYELVNSTPIFDDSGKILAAYLVMIDITEQKKVENDLIKAKEKAESADQLKSEFLAQMSHEIRSPINTILNSVSLLKEDVGDYNEEVKSIFPILDSAGSRIIKTIDSILNMSELQLGIYEPHFKELNLIEDILKMLCSEFKYLSSIKNLEFNYIQETEEVKLFVDQYSTSQIFSNLIDNAIKYTNRGSISVRVYRNENDLLAVDVIDTGIGISKEFLPSLFTPFSQEEQGYTRKYEGNGLGLALIKKYCSINNASILVKSEKNEGSVFTVEFKL